MNAKLSRFNFFLRNLRVTTILLFGQATIWILQEILQYKTVSTRSNYCSILFPNDPCISLAATAGQFVIKSLCSVQHNLTFVPSVFCVSCSFLHVCWIFVVKGAGVKEKWGERRSFRSRRRNGGREGRHRSRRIQHFQRPWLLQVGIFNFKQNLAFLIIFRSTCQLLFVETSKVQSL